MGKILDKESILIIGNPPWVTNAELSSLNSGNLPLKSNFKSYNGLEAITGKGNFDIGEYIILMMLNSFAKHCGYMAMLAKNSVIKNVIYDLPKNNYIFDGICPFIWRQGIKHDCSKILELQKSDGRYINGFNEQLEIEDDLIFGLVKSSDLQSPLIEKPRKYIIVTQKKVGEETAYIEGAFPNLYKYLMENVRFFTERKSSIYKGKPQFSVFGVGDYSFKPYKVAISGLYKKPSFSLVLPFNDKHVMLDDTCYFL